MVLFNLDFQLSYVYPGNRIYEMACSISFS